MTATRSNYSKWVDIRYIFWAKEHTKYGELSISPPPPTLRTPFSNRIYRRCRGFLEGDFALWRLLFIGGLIAGGAIGAQVLPGSFETLPATYTLARAAAAGALVGAGSCLGNGCTSGHGIAGIARCSETRSIRIQQLCALRKRIIASCNIAMDAVSTAFL
jgi:uncharacterized membrane protein YedE/YeeE